MSVQNGMTCAPAGMMSSLEMSSSTLSISDKARSAPEAESCGRLTMFLVFCSFVAWRAAPVLHDLRVLHDLSR